MGRYSGDVAGPLTATIRFWRRTMSPSTGSGPRARPPLGHTPGPPRDRAKSRLLRLYAALLGCFGPRRWWPGRTPYEVAVGAVLTQHTAWPNAARAVEALRAQRLLTPARAAALAAPRMAHRGARRRGAARPTALDAGPGGGARRLRPGRRDPTSRNPARQGAP